MNKKVIITAVVLIVVVIAAFIFTPYFFSDKLTSSEFYPVGDESENYVFRSATERGYISEGLLGVEKKALSENYYLYSFTFNDNTDEDTPYNISDFTLNLELGDNVSVTEGFMSVGEGMYSTLGVRDGTVTAVSENGYMHCTILLYSEYGISDLSVTLNYTISGNGLYSKNRFSGQKINLMI